ncbi:glucose-1-phosphate adenylyltransferase small subunit chloroplastic/amyloplastic [Phtheirospermum japonicum]|uniref:glucose-1-phosphate adenylyltransferase n=1 Tax=Phtheirospermum japonicum TaxID=374723 RepID=A0A830BTB8_9LAMI|nr:glucose-1-phosphate adenylyltransferase small subunit chloroplastic/amyloplastic [Phtheirospermum japonicum]
MTCRPVVHRGFILGGGQNFEKRAKPVVPLGANYRLIDIHVSNCLNSNISKIYVLTQFNFASLNSHLSIAYASNMGGYKNELFVEVLAAQQTPKNPNWFQDQSEVRVFALMVGLEAEIAGEDEQQSGAGASSE